MIWVAKSNKIQLTVSVLKWAVLCFYSDSLSGFLILRTQSWAPLTLIHFQSHPDLAPAPLSESVKDGLLKVSTCASLASHVWCDQNQSLHSTSQFIKNSSSYCFHVKCGTFTHPDALNRNLGSSLTPPSSHISSPSLGLVCTDSKMHTESVYLLPTA